MYILGIDFGSRYIKAALTIVDNDNKVTIVETFSQTHKASRKGTITDLVKAKEAFKSIIEKVRIKFDEEIDFYLITISGEGVTTFTGTTKIPLWKQENEERRVKITKAHVNEVIKTAKSSYITDNKVELHSIPQEYTIDDQQPTQNPIDMSGVKLKGSVYVIQAEKTQKENLANILSDCGIENYRIIYSPLATSEAVLDEDDKETGMIMISIGDQTTELVIYHGGILRMAKVIPFGSYNITKDLKILLKTDTKTADFIKKNNATAFEEDADPEKEIEFESSGLQNKYPTEAYVAKIVASRLKEVYDFVIHEIYKGSYQRIIHSPVMLTGPGGKLKGADKLFSQMNNSKTINGKICGVNLKGKELQEDMFTVVGLVKYAVNHDLIISEHEENEESKGFIFKMKRFFADIF
ncbi:MAG: cell division protein FtsA [Candidatus Delongbacteria bacterium]|jgi:cell division protein FtsA|nr:cell division protein FtsA [Candidatus Delongbacteria bacterium]